MTRLEPDKRIHGYCLCERLCSLTAAERYRKRVRCRYRHGAVQPLSKLNKAAADAQREADAKSDNQ